MAIQQIDIQPALDAAKGRELPTELTRFLDAAELRIDALYDEERNRQVPKFFPSDATLLHHALIHLQEEDRLLGNSFCEWGSGMGVGIGVATMLGFEAYGIELEKPLVDESRELLAGHGIDAKVIHGSYLPDGLDSHDGGIGGEELVVYREEDSDESSFEYEGMPMALEEVDLFYVYPWPGEQEFILDLFAAVAAPGALLVAYLGDGDLCAYLLT